jgi:hypothetical protein
VWYVVRPAVEGDIVIYTHSADFDTQLSVFVGEDCSHRQCVAANDDDGKQRTSRIRVSAEAGRQYYAVVHGYGAAVGSFALTLATDCVRPPQSVIRCGSEAPTTGTTVPSVVDPSLTDCTASPTAGHAAWHPVVVPPGTTVVITTAGSAFDTQLAVYRGCNAADRACIVRNDDVSATERTSRVTFVPGTGRYYLVVHGYGSRTGRYQLTVRCS